MSKKSNPHSSEKFPWVADNLMQKKNNNGKTNNSNNYNYLENLTVTQKDNLKLPSINNKQQWPNRKSFSSPKKPACVDSTPNTTSANTLSRYRISRMNNFKQLPVIEEEDGHCSEEDLDLRNYFFSNSELKDTYLNRKTINILIKNKFSKKLIKKENSENLSGNNLKPPMKLPSLLTINCLMNANIKQTQQIWETNFGKRLINGKQDDGKMNLSKSEEDKIENKKYEDEWPSKEDEYSLPDENKFLINNLKIGGGDTEDDDFTGLYKSSVIKNSKKGSSKEKRKTHHLKKCRTSSIKASQDFEFIDAQQKNTNQVINTSENDNFLKKEDTQDFQHPSEIESNKSVFLSTGNRHLLTKCVKRILDDSCEEIICEFCNESFSKYGELLSHKKEGQQSCLICNKVFCKAEDFIEHLLTHESVDKFSCRTCRKYFPNLKKYKEHNKKFHFFDREISTIYPEIQERENIINYVNKFHSNYVCTRCKMNFDSKENLRAHKRWHLKVDLNVADFLFPDNVSML